MLDPQLLQKMKIDGTVTAEDCDDADAESTVVADDGDCDGVLTAEDCDDANQNPQLLQTMGL